MSKILRFSLAVFVLVAMSAFAMAQSTVTGAIGGTVTNPNNEVVPGATVTVRDTETNKDSTATTDDQGRFVVPTLSTRGLTVYYEASHRARQLSIRQWTSPARAGRTQPPAASSRCSAAR